MEAASSEACLAFLVVGSELSDFLSNSIRSLREVEPSVPVFVFVEPGLEGSFSFLVESWGVTVLAAPVREDFLSGPYHSFGTREFNYISSLKWAIFLELFSRGFEVVVYSDVDVVFLAPFLNYLRAVARSFPAALQSEAQPTFPPLLCTGFMFFCSSWRDVIVEFQAISESIDFALNDQEVTNSRLLEDEQFQKQVYELPSHLFANGLLVDSVAAQTLASSPTTTYFAFHANFVAGTDRKREALEKVGHWNP